MSKKTIIIIYLSLWTSLALMAWFDQSTIGKLVASLDIGSAVALATLAAYAYYQARKDDDFITLIFEDSDGNRLDKLLTAVRRDECSRSELAGVLRAYNSGEMFKIASLNSNEYREQLRAVKAGKTDTIVIKLNLGDHLASLIVPSTSETLPSNHIPVFLNISNHPSTTWSETQLEASKLIDSKAQIVDFPFPLVDPTWSTIEVKEAAKHTWNQIQALLNTRDQKVIAAMIAGEPIMCSYLVGLLKHVEIKCYSATTTREVQMDENGVKQSTFTFVRFREWP